MRITADTNVLVRALTADDARQSQIATSELEAADLVALPLTVLCELVWVLKKAYGLPSMEIARAIRILMNSATVAVDRPAAEAGLALLDAGGDFADGVIAHEGRWLGAECFVSFDKAAVGLLQERREQARLLV